MSVVSGQVVRGYELHELLGVGGFGAVYRAYQPAVKRDVAVKIILPQYANQPDFIRRFEMEAELVARLEHLHIVPLYDYWREPGGAYLVMRLLRGGSLRSLLQERGPLDLETAATFLDQITGALATAHRRGVIHRDIKPDNILLDEEGNTYLTDFGIAQDIDTMEPGDDEDDVFAGSLTYASPEQIRGLVATPESDIYSLGIVLYEMLAGEHPFPGAQPATLITKHLNEPLPEIHTRFTDFAAEIDGVIQRATAKDPGDRYPDAPMLSSAFRRALRSSKRRIALPGGVPMAPVMDTTPTPFDSVLPDIETPYKGLRAFQEADAAEFFGREALVEQVLARMAEANQDVNARFLAVVGPSGSGKSSLVRAGLMPALRQGALPGSQNWYFVEMMPGERPYHELESALLRVAVTPPEDLLSLLVSDERGLVQAMERVLPPGDDACLFLLIDQFEEVFTMVESEETRAKFLKNLWTAVTEPTSKIRLVITLRADYYDRPLVYPGIGDLLRKRTEVVLPLTVEELQRAIMEPALRVGVDLEPGLVTAIVHDVSEQPGALPLMQYALTELFERRDGRMLRLETYHQIGGALGALARRADELYAGLDTAGQEAAQQMFLRLVVPSDGGETMRRRVSRAELLSLSSNEGVMEGVIDAFGRHRLLTFDRDPVTRGPTIEVAHEALIKQWGRLRDWLEKYRDDLQQHRRLMAAVDEWLNARGDPSFLARGIRLEQFETWAGSTSLALSMAEISYLNASIAAREARLAEEEAQRQREAALDQRARHRLRVLALVLLLSTLGALGLTGVALQQSSIAQKNAATATFAQGAAFVEAANAQTQAAIAQINAVEAQSLALSASAQLALKDGNTDLAVLLALQANRIAQPLQARLALADVDYSPGTIRQMTGHRAAVSDVAISRDGGRIVSAARDGSIIVWNARTGEIVTSLSGHTDRVTGVAFSPDGQYILSGSWDGTARLWDASAFEEVRRVRQAGGVVSLAFSPGGRTFVTGGADGTVLLWDTATGEEQKRFSGHTAGVTAVSFSPDGQFIASASMDRAVRTWNVTTGRPMLTMTGHTDRVTTLAYHPNGRTLATGGNDDTIRIWNTMTGDELRQLSGHTDAVTRVVFDPTGHALLSTSWDASMILWNLDTGQPVHHFIGHAAAITSAVMSADGYLAVSASDDTTVRLWELNAGSESRRLRFYVDEIAAVAASPITRTAVVAGANNSFVLWDLDSGRQLRRFLGHDGSILALAFNTKGDQIVSSSTDGTVIVWNADTGEEIRRLEGHADIVSSLDFSLDSRTLLTGSWDRTLILWDVETGEPIRRYEGGHADRILTVSITADGRGALSGSNDGGLVLWDLDTGDIVRSFDTSRASNTQIAVSPDARTMLVASSDGLIRRWEITTGSLLETFVGHRSAVLAVAITPDGTTALSGSRDRSLILWDIASGTQIHRFEGHTDAVTSVAFIQGGLAAISGSRDKTVRLWRTLSLNGLVQWTYTNRYIPPLDCDSQFLYRVEVLCAATPGVAPESAPLDALAAGRS